MANGAIPGLICIYAYLSDDWDTIVWVFGAAVAVAASDTFASEIGCLDPRVRMITTFKSCEQGENGGFSPNGQLAAAAGSSVVARSDLHRLVAHCTRYRVRERNPTLRCLGRRRLARVPN